MFLNTVMFFFKKVTVSVLKKITNATELNL